MRRQSAAFLLLILLFFITVGYHILLRVQIAEAKTEMKKTLFQVKDEAITKFEFNEKQLAALDWENNSEFSLNDELYDVMAKRVENGNTIILCVSDEKETALVSIYQKIQTNNSSDKSTSGIFLKLITAPFLPSSIIKFQTTVILPKNYNNFLPRQLTVTHSEIVTPPPRVC